MGQKAFPDLRNRVAVSLGRGLGVLFIAMGITVGSLSLLVLEPFHWAMHYTDESLNSAEGIAGNVRSGVESSSGLIGGVSGSLRATSSALDETVSLLVQTGNTLERIREVMPGLSGDLRSMARVAGPMIPGNRLGETSEKLDALHDHTEDLEEEIMVLSLRVLAVRESLDTLTFSVDSLQEDISELENSLSGANRSLSRLAGSFSPSLATAVFLWGSLVLAALLILTGVFLLLKLDQPGLSVPGGTGTRRRNP
jgi:archaellum component FlaC